MRSSSRTVRGTLLVAGSLALVASSCAAQTGRTTAASGGNDRAIPSFTYALSDLPTSLNSMTAKLETARVSALVTEPLEQISFQNGAVTFKPGLATSVTEPAAATLVYKLRDAKFSDGSPLTAEDVAWSITAAAAPTAETAGNLQGFGSAKVTGPLQVTITWKYPNPNLRASLSLAGVLVQEATFAQAHRKDLGTSAALPIGTGPYKFESQNAQDIVLTPNPSYWGSRPKVQKLTFTAIAQDNSAQLAMRSGTLQGTKIADLKTTSQWQGIKGTSLHTAHDLTSDLVSMDTSKPPFDDIHVRKAIGYAIDRQGIAAAAFGGHADQLQTLVPSAELAGVASEQEIKTFLDQLPQQEFSIEKAKAELAQSVHPNGFSVEVPYVNTVTWERLLLLNLQENLKPLGITITPKPVPQGQWYQTFFSHQATGIQLINRFSTTLPDPSGLFYAFIGKATMQPNFPNSANFTTPSVETAYPALAPETAYKFSKEQRWDATKSIATEISNQVPYVPLYSEHTVYALAAGYTYTQTPTLLDVLSGAWIQFIRATDG